SVRAAITARQPGQRRHHSRWKGGVSNGNGEDSQAQCSATAGMTQGHSVLEVVRGRMIVEDRNVDRLGGFERCEGERPVGGRVIETGCGGVVAGGVIDRQCVAAVAEPLHCDCRDSLVLAYGDVGRIKNAGVGIRIRNELNDWLVWIPKEPRDARAEKQASAVVYNNIPEQSTDEHAPIRLNRHRVYQTS